MPKATPTPLLTAVQAHYPNAIRAFLTTTDRQDLGFVVPTIEGNVAPLIDAEGTLYQFACIRPTTIDVTNMGAVQGLVVYYQPLL